MDAQTLKAGIETDSDERNSATVDDYITFLFEHCGLCHGSARNHQRTCEALLQFLHGRGTPDLALLKPAAILDFLVTLGSKYSRTTLSSVCAQLRGFLRHLYRLGVTERDLSLSVVSPRVYRHEACPRYLDRAEIEAVLAVIDRSTVVGLRDYAMMLLLATYGLRASEVTRLRLDAIDWRNQRLHIHKRKAGNSSTYPLDAQVGEAILAYLEHGRPKCKHREVFLSSVRPFGPFRTGGIVSTQARNYIAKAGIRPERSGSHIFRYSCAQRLFEQDVPLKTIGDFLGHGNSDSTRRYTKIAFDQLRDVALGDGEDVL